MVERVNSGASLTSVQQETLARTAASKVVDFFATRHFTFGEQREGSWARGSSQRSQLVEQMAEDLCPHIQGWDPSRNWAMQLGFSHLERTENGQKMVMPICTGIFRRERLVSEFPHFVVTIKVFSNTDYTSFNGAYMVIDGECLPATEEGEIVENVTTLALREFGKRYAGDGHTLQQRMLGDSVPVTEVARWPLQGFGREEAQVRALAHDVVSEGVGRYLHPQGERSRLASMWVGAQREETTVVTELAQGAEWVYARAAALISNFFTMSPDSTEKIVVLRPRFSDFQNTDPRTKPFEITLWERAGGDGREVVEIGLEGQLIEL